MSKFTYPNQNELLIGIVVGGDSEDPAPDQAGGFRVHIPSLYGPKVKHKDLPFARMLSQGTQEGVQNFNPPPERGSVVLLQKGGGPGHPGTGHLIVVGVLPNTIMKGLGVPGGKSLASLFQDSVDHKTDKKAPPKSLNTTSRNGAEIREVKDGEMWSHSLTKAIPATATMWNMSGIPLPPVKSVATAIQHSTGVLGGNLLSSMPGMSMSLGKMFSMLNSSGLLSQITSKLSPEMSDALQSMSNLITNVEVSSGYGFAVGDRVDPTTFLNNAVKVLSTAQNINDLVNGMNTLSSDESLHGTDKLDSVKVKVATPYGNTTVKVSSDGSVEATINIAMITIRANANTANANTANTVAYKPPKDEDEKEANEYINSIMGFVNMLQSPEQAFASTGKNMFGDSAKMMFDVFNRLNPGGTAHMKQLVETVNTGQTAQKNIKPLLDLAITKGGNILGGRGFS
jgi:hypothetical protein